MQLPSIPLNAYNYMDLHDYRNLLFTESKDYFSVNILKLAFLTRPPEACS